MSYRYIFVGTSKAGGGSRPLRVAPYLHEGQVSDGVMLGSSFWSSMKAEPQDSKS